MINSRLSGFDRALLEIRQRVIELARSVDGLNSKGLGTLSKPETLADTDWRREDDKIDQLRDQVIQRIHEVMTLQQLRAQDLFWLLGYQRIAQEVERLADYACDIAEMVGFKPQHVYPPQILQMAEQTNRMYARSLEALEQELNVVTELEQWDDLLDTGYAALQKQFLAETRSGQSESLGFPLVVARTLERMGDHIVNVAQALVYIKTGEKR